MVVLIVDFGARCRHHLFLHSTPFSLGVCAGSFEVSMGPRICIPRLEKPTTTRAHDTRLATLQRRPSLSHTRRATGGDPRHDDRSAGSVEPRSLPSPHQDGDAIVLPIIYLEGPIGQR